MGKIMVPPVFVPHCRINPSSNTLYPFLVNDLSLLPCEAGDTSLPSQGNKSSSVTDNGYVELDNGLIIQWGCLKNLRVLSSPIFDNSNKIVFPKPFPHKVFSVSTTLLDVHSNNRELPVGDTNTVLNVSNYNQQYFYVSADEIADDSPYIVDVSWIAIGY